MKTVYLCGDTLTGLFSALYDAWKAALAGRACGIAVKGEVELQLFCDYVEVEETERKAEAVITLIKKHLGHMLIRRSPRRRCLMIRTRERPSWGPCLPPGPFRTAGRSWTI